MSFAHYTLPKITNEPNKHYAPGSSERAALAHELESMSQRAPFYVPAFVNGKEVKASGALSAQPMPSSHANNLCEFSASTPELTQEAIDAALAARSDWEQVPWQDRASIFLRAAELISGKYRAKLCAATMLGQGKNIWQAEIDAAAEICDFFRFGAKQVESIYVQQPSEHSAGVWNRSEYRPLEGFVFAISPFNFTAICGNLVAAPAMVGNVCVWKPSPMATYASWLVLTILHEAGLPKNVIQFLPCPNGDQTVQLVNTALAHKNFAALHFTGSTFVFKSLWKTIASNIDNYLNYPRIVGETGGKNFQLVHASADIPAAVAGIVRGAFEYQGQKCSATSRLYVPRSIWDTKGGFKEQLLAKVGSITVGPITQLENFMGPVISKASFDKCLGYVDKAKQAGGKVLIGGVGDDSKGYFVQPTVIETADPLSVTMREEIFGPVLTAYVYDDDKFEDTCRLIDRTTDYGLTGCIFANDRDAIVTATNLLRYASGMWYINDKSTGAVVGQQPFGGARASGTNDKAGSSMVFYRFLNVRTIKETFVPPTDYVYPSNFK